jgi:hypothetical protein
MGVEGHVVLACFASPNRSADGHPSVGRHRFRLLLRQRCLDCGDGCGDLCHIGIHLDVSLGPVSGHSSVILRRFSLRRVVADFKRFQYLRPIPTAVKHLTHAVLGDVAWGLGLLRQQLAETLGIGREVAAPATVVIGHELLNGFT